MYFLVVFFTILLSLVLIVLLISSKKVSVLCPVDTFHDSGTSGHEPDSLEAIHTLVKKEASALKRKNEDHCEAPEEGRSGGVARGVSEAGVLLHLERCAHR